MAKYLARYASPEAALGPAVVRALDAARYEHVCVVPAMGESMRLVDGVAPAMPDSRALCVLVVNARDSADAWVHSRNHELVSRLRHGAREVIEIADGPPMWLCRSVVAEASDVVLDILLVDRAQPGWRLPARQGVGLARCIGCDLALALMQAGCVTSRWIHTTDGDAMLPARYFAAAESVPDNSVALTYPFWHQTEGERGRALGLYELSLRYYVLGLRWAGSPYAFATIGSTLAVDASAYAAVRGVPKRMAGEDFYMLSKLAKLGPVVQPACAPIRLRQRTSVRVPFGTAPAMARIAENLAQDGVFTMYHPHSFAALRCWLEAMDGFTRDPDMTPARCIEESIAACQDRDQASALDRALAIMGVAEKLADARARVTSAAALGKRLHGWFDGFRTLKLIHCLRDAGLANMPWQQALAGAPFVPDVPAGATLDEIRQAFFRVMLEPPRTRS